MVQYQWFEIKFNLLGGLTNKNLNKGNYSYNSFLIYIYSSTTHSLRNFINHIIHKPSPQKKFMTIANINAINSNIKELGKPKKKKKKQPTLLSHPTKGGNLLLP